MILTAAECRVALGLTASITDLDRALIETLLPKVDAAIQQELKYDPRYSQRIEWYPRGESAGFGAEGVWDATARTAFFGEINRSSTLQLAAIPVRKVDQVLVDYIGGFGQKSGSFGADTEWALGTQWWQDLIAQGHNATGHLFSMSGWPREPGTVKVTYWAGYSDDELLGRATAGPNDGDVALNASGIKKAALLTMVKAFKTLKAHGQQTLAGMVAGPITSETLGAYSYSADASLVAALTGMSVSVPSEALQDLSPFKHFGLMVL